jgi:hypothetical protein
VVKKEMVDQVTTDILLIIRHHRTGLIPTEIGQLINLKTLVLWSNKLTGRWPKYEMVELVATGILLIL